MKISREEALVRLNESNAANQRILEERMAIQARIDHLPFGPPKEIEILAEIKVAIEGEVNKKLFEQHLKTFKHRPQ